MLFLPAVMSNVGHRSDHDFVRHAAAQRKAGLAAHDNDATAFALADDQFGADVQPHLGQPTIKSAAAHERSDPNMLAGTGHAESYNFV